MSVKIKDLLEEKLEKANEKDKNKNLNEIIDGSLTKKKEQLKVMESDFVIDKIVREVPYLYLIGRIKEGNPKHPNIHEFHIKTSYFSNYEKQCYIRLNGQEYTLNLKYPGSSLLRQIYNRAKDFYHIKLLPNPKSRWG